MPQSVPNIQVQTPPGARQVYEGVVIEPVNGPGWNGPPPGDLISESAGQYLLVGGANGWFNTGSGVAVPFTMTAAWNGQPIASRRSTMRGIEHHFTGMLAADLMMLPGHNYMTLNAVADNGTIINTAGHDYFMGYLIPNITGAHRFGYSAPVSGVSQVDIPINIGTPGPYVACISPIFNIVGTTGQQSGAFSYSIDGGPDVALAGVGVHVASRDNDPHAAVPIAWGSVPGVFPSLDNVSAGNHIVTFKVGPSSPGGFPCTFEGQQLLVMFYNGDGKIGTSYRGGVPAPGPATNSFDINAVISGHVLAPALGQAYVGMSCFSSFTTVAGQVLNTGLIIDTSGGLSNSGAFGGDPDWAINPVSVHQPLGFMCGEWDSPAAGSGNLAWLDTSLSRTSYAWSHNTFNRFMALSVPRQVILP